MKRITSATPNTTKGCDSNTNSSGGDGDGDGSSRYNKLTVNLPPWHQSCSSGSRSSSSNCNSAPTARNHTDENENTMSNANILSNDSYGRRMKVSVIYYLSRGHGQSIDPPHLLQGYLHSSPAGQSDGGLRLRDFKKWLGALRGECVADAFAWSYKRRYKEGFIWHDLGADNDFIQPLQLLPRHDHDHDHDHDQTGITTTTTEYVLMGSELNIPRQHHHHHHHQDIGLSSSKWSKWGAGGGGAMNNAVQVQVMNNYNMDVGTQTGESRRCSIDDDDDDNDDGVINDNDNDDDDDDDDDDDEPITNDHNGVNMLHISKASRSCRHGPIPSWSGLDTATAYSRVSGDTRVISSSGINLASDRNHALHEATTRIQVLSDRNRALNETMPRINVLSDRNRVLNEAPPRINVLSDRSRALNEATLGMSVLSDRNRAQNEATPRIYVNNNNVNDKKHHHHHQDQDQGHRCVRHGHHGGAILRQLLTCGNVDVVRKTDEVMMSYMSSHSTGQCDGVLDTSSTPRSVNSSCSTTTTTKCHAKFFPHSKKTGSPVLGALGTRTTTFPSSPYWKCNPGALILNSTRRRNGTSFSASMSRDATSTVATTFSDTRSARTSCENKLRDSYNDVNERGSIRHACTNTNHTNNLYNNVQSCGSCHSPMLSVCSSTSRRKDRLWYIDKLGNLKRSSIRESDMGDHHQQHQVETEGITLREIVNGPSRSKGLKSTSGKPTMSLHESIMNEIRSNRLSPKTTNHKTMRALSNNVSTKFSTPHHDEDHQEEEMMMIMNNYITMNDDNIRGEEQENGYGSLHNHVRSSNNSWRDLMFWSPRFNHKLDKRGDNRCFS